MALVTGTPLGTIVTSKEIYIEGAPYIYVQDYNATPLKNPDASGFYWGLSGTSTYPVYNIGCMQDCTLTENITMNMIRCDYIGDKGVIQKRNHIEFNFSFTTLLPLPVLRYLLKLSAVTTAGSINTMGIGAINNNQFFHVYLPKVYDDDTGDWLMVYLHKASFADAWTINMRQGEPWQVTGIKLYGGQIAPIQMFRSSE